MSYQSCKSCFLHIRTLVEHHKTTITIVWNMNYVEIIKRSTQLLKSPGWTAKLLSDVVHSFCCVLDLGSLGVLHLWITVLQWNITVINWFFPSPLFFYALWQIVIENSYLNILKGQNIRSELSVLCCCLVPTVTPVERKECYFNLNDENLCDKVLASSMTIEECCCTLGAGWGDNCEVHPCPLPGTGTQLHHGKQQSKKYSTKTARIWG